MSVTGQTLRKIMSGDLVVHLKLDSVAEPSEEGQKVTVPDSSGNNNRATVHGSPKLVSDDRFGRCLELNRTKLDGEPDDYLELPTAGDIFTGGWTFSSWIYLESEKAQILYAKDVVDFFIEGNELYIYNESREYDELKRNKWAHLALSVQADGSARLEVNRDLVIDTIQEFPDAAALNAATWLVGQFPNEVGWRFSGKMAHARLYNQALNLEKIQRQMSLDELPMLDFSVGSPLEFKLWDEEQNSVIYLEGGEISHKLTVAIWNEDPENLPIEFDEPDMSSLGENPDDFFRRNHHLELRLPVGTISKGTRSAIAEDLERAKNGNADPDFWYIHYHDHPNSQGTSLYLLHHGATTIPADANIPVEIVLPHFEADKRTGARVVPVELRPGPLAKRSDCVIVGPRITRLNVLSQRGQKHLPLHFDIVGSDTVINDGSSWTSRLLRITNVDREERIRFVTEGDKMTRFILKCEIAEKGGHHEWALTDEPGKIKLRVEPQRHESESAKPPDPDSDSDWNQGDAIDPEEPTGRTVVWVIEGKRLKIHKLDATQPANVLAPNESIYLRLNVQTQQRTGPTDLHLEFRNIPGYWSGSRVCTLHKSPLNFHRDAGTGLDYVGIGTNQPASKLSVTEGLTVGAGWAAVQQAPDNGLLVEGKVGIGTYDPRSKLAVAGKATIGDREFEPLAQLHAQGPEAKKSVAHFGVDHSDDAFISIRGGGANEAYLRLENSELAGLPEPEAWMVGMDDDRKFKASFGTGTDITDANSKLTLDSTGEFQVKGRIKDQTGYVMPVGTIMPYGGKIAPEGWELCNGKQLFLKDDGTTEDPRFQKLYEVIGKSFGSGRNQKDWTTSRTVDKPYFRLPDLQGRFLRGVDNNQYPESKRDQGKRTAYNRGASGVAVGSVQEDAFKNHTHIYGRTGFVYGAKGGDSTPQTEDPVDVDTGSSGGSETRPKNIYVNFIIKY